MSDTDSSEEPEFIDPLDKFIFDNSNDIIDLYYDLKSRVPWFFGNTCVPLYCLIIDQFDTIMVPKKLVNTFLYEYQNEIQVTLNVVNTFLYKRKCKPINVCTWQHFCYNTF